MSSSIESQSLPSTKPPSNLSLENLKNNKSVKNILTKIKELSQQKNNHDLSVTDDVSKYVLDLSNLLESMYLSFGTTWLIADICNHIVKLFELTNLETYGYIVYEVLPDKFKNKNKDTFKEFRKKQEIKQINDNFHTLEKVDYKGYDTDTIIELRKKMASESDKLDDVLESRGIDAEQILEQDQLQNLKRLEKERFAKSSIGKSVASVEELIAKYGDDYKKAYEFLDNTLKKFVKTAQLNYEWFCVRYPPITAEDCVRCADSYSNIDELLRPFADDKYRLDHWKAMNLAITKTTHTSQKASRESRVMCANMKDKHGYYLYRSITKEQIEASYEWELNFMRKTVVTILNWLKVLSDVNAKNGERAKADRSVQLSGHLSHHA